MNLLIALSTQGLIGAAFPTTGIPEIPKLRSTHVGPAVPIVGGNSLGINPRSTLKPTSAVNERMDRQWSGTLTWQGMDTTLNERKEVRAQVTVIASKGNPCAFLWNSYSLTIYIHVPIQIGINMAQSLVTCACWTCGVNGRVRHMDGEIRRC